ncbi:MAG: hypothetical protein M3Y08_05435 [Fibrobacterota bacterium]|nr:hypothetical protein [Fibrobacterota bacterium]
MDPRLPSELDKKSLMPAATAAMACFYAFLLSGCLYTTHHFNSGRILDPGQTAVTLGYGRAEMYSVGCPDGYSRVGRGSDRRCLLDFNSISRGIADPDTIPQELSTQPLPKFSLSYRLGVRGAWGPFTGVEMGWQIEAPTNPGTVEFDLKFGLPLPKKLKAQHSLSAGWGVGMWADNAWFGEYAASRNFGPHALYGNYRFTYMATQPAELDSSFNNWKFSSHRRYSNQASLGFFYRMPDWVLLPDYLSPQVTFTFPVTPAFYSIAPSYLPGHVMNVNMGFGWNF